MASEINLTSNLSVAKGGTSVASATSTLTTNMQSSLNNMIDTTQTLTAAADTAVTLGSIATATDYIVRLRNQDATNYVEVSIDGGLTYHMKMMPGEFWGPVRIEGGNVVHAKANTAACIIEIVACEAGNPLT